MLHPATIVSAVFVIFGAAAVISTLALFTRQSLLVAYIVVGALLGPWGFKLISDSSVIQQTGEFGIIFLLFLLGLNLHPQNLWHMLRKMTWITVVSSGLLALLGFGVGLLFHYSVMTSFIIGAAMMFSSTIIALKLLPTTVLHHQHTGELVISILLMQDLLAIIMLLLIGGPGAGHFSIWSVVRILVAFPILCAASYLCQRFILVKLFARFDRIKEYTFLISIAWCLSLAELGKILGLTDAIGAFIAGVALAASPISLYIAESLKPLRDFFLIMFFFSIGAAFNIHYVPEIFIPALILAALMLAAKPLLYRFLLHRASESRHVAWEVGVRLGQMSEFSLLLAYLAAAAGIIDKQASCLIQAATILTFMVSSYFVVMRYPTPIALTDKLRRD